MARIMLIIGGIFNTFHAIAIIWVGVRHLDVVNLSNIVKGVLSVLTIEAFPIYVFFAIVSFFYTKELLSSKLGRITCGVIVVVYALTSICDIILSNRHAITNLLGLIVAGLYVFPLLMENADSSVVKVEA
jgi:hypothetical protein